MLEAIRDYTHRTGRQVGFKAAGGVSTSKAALHRLVLAKETLGDAWLTPDRFRIGASSRAQRTTDAVPEDRDRALRARRGLLEGVSSMDVSAASIVWDYAPAPESTDHVRLRDGLRPVHRRRVRAPLDGAPRADDRPRDRGADRPDRLAGRGRPARGDRGSARGAAGAGALPGRERAKYLFRIARLIQERARELAVVESMDGGKPLRESRDVDIPLAAAHFFHYAGWADKLRYGVGGRAARRSASSAQIVPWNFPLLMAAWKLAPALACGNTAILKPAETTPLTALLLAEIIQEAELPAGRGGDPARRRRDRRRARALSRASTSSPSPARPRSASDIQAALPGARSG